MTDKFSTPDDHGEITMSDIRTAEWAKTVTDAHTFIVPALWFGAALFFWLGMRFLFAPSAGHLRRRLGRWIAGDRD